MSFYLSECCLIHHHPLQHLLRLPGIKKTVPHRVLKIGIVCPLVPGPKAASLRLPCRPPTNRLMLGEHARPPVQQLPGSGADTTHYEPEKTSGLGRLARSMTFALWGSRQDS